MHTAQSKLFEKAKSLPRQSINVAAYRGESQVLRVLFVLLSLAIAGYLYFVGVSIMNVIMSREASLQSQRLQSSVASLEEEYFTLSKNVSAEAAATYGLSAPAGTTFARRESYLASNVTSDGL